MSRQRDLLGATLRTCFGEWTESQRKEVWEQLDEARQVQLAQLYPNKVFGHVSKPLGIDLGQFEVPVMADLPDLLQNEVPGPVSVFPVSPVALGLPDRLKSKRKRFKGFEHPLPDLREDVLMCLGMQPMSVGDMTTVLELSAPYQQHFKGENYDVIYGEVLAFVHDLVKAGRATWSGVLYEPVRLL